MRLTLLLNKSEELAKLTANPLPNLAVPALYCLRHALELLLKFLSLGFRESLAYTHDVPKLFESVKTQLLSVDANVLEAAAASLGVDSNLIITYMQSTTDKLERIVTKYHRFTGVRDDVEDEKNEAFRYPSSLSDGTPLQATMETDCISIDSVRGDIEHLRNYLFGIALMFGKTPDGRYALADSTTETSE
jgi:hypothetical protein